MLLVAGANLEIPGDQSPGAGQCRSEQTEACRTKVAALIQVQACFELGVEAVFPENRVGLCPSLLQCIHHDSSHEATTADTACLRVLIDAITGGTPVMRCVMCAVVLI